jgi:predicted phage tail protein
MKEINWSKVVFGEVFLIWPIIQDSFVFASGSGATVLGVGMYVMGVSLILSGIKK